MIRLRTFGPVSLLGPDGSELSAVLAQPKRLALLIYLAAARPQGVHRRDRLLALFWPELDGSRARDALNQALRFLRQTLGSSALMRRSAEDIGVDPSRVWCDVPVFRAAIAEARWEDALGLYRADFLEAFFVEGASGFEEWMEGERAALRDQAARAARELARRHQADGALTLAIRWGRRAHEFFPDDERALRELLRLHISAGDHAGALRLYDGFARRLETEWGSTPSPETQQLIEDLRDAGPTPGAAGAQAPAAPSEPEGSGRAEPDDSDGARDRDAHLPPGLLAGRYRIERRLSTGGTATVHLARDIRHDRDVAVKILHHAITEAVARDRFLREMRIAGRLQHPGIVPLFDSGDAHGRLFYVMPFIPGETLRQRLRRGRPEMDEVLSVLREVADSLSYAHEQGVIHRDIKPANILLVGARAMVTDFGIARAADMALPQGSPERMLLTQPGSSFGTPAYMAPEQAAGDPQISPLADLYALGVLGYEMLAGRPPFIGETPQQILAAKLTERPADLLTFRPDAPAWLAGLLMQCLHRDPAHRPASARAVLARLTARGASPAHRHNGPVMEVATATPAGDALPMRTGNIRRLDRRAGVAAALLLGIALTAIAFALRRDGQVGQVARLAIVLDTAHSVFPGPGDMLALTPDGQTVVYVGRDGLGTRLYRRRIDELEAHPIPGTTGARFPAVSPDGRQIAYRTPAGLMVQSLAGGPPAPVLGSDANSGAATVWVDNETLLTPLVDGTLASVTLDGAWQTVAAADSALPVWAVSAVLPGGRTALATRGFDTYGVLVAADLRSGASTRLVEGDINGAWYARGALLWSETDGSLRGAPFDADRLRITGPSVTLATRVRLAVGGPVQAAVSTSGSLVYLPEKGFSLVLVDRDGRRETLAEGRRFHNPRFSPDGGRIAVDFFDRGSRDVWTIAVGPRTFTRVSFEGDGHDAVWAPDGRYLYFVHGRGIYRRRADESGAADSVFVGPALTAPLQIARGSGFALTVPVNGASRDLGLLTLNEEPRSQRPLISTPFTEEAGTLSPDGRWLAYTSNETGRSEVYVQSFPDGGPRIRISRNGGGEPVWHPAGTELFYLGTLDGAPYLFAAKLRTAADVQVLDRTPLFPTAGFEPASPHANYDIAPDGSRFVMVHHGLLSELAIILNWPEEIRRRSGQPGN